MAEGPRTGSMFGPYHLRDLLGRGAMGEVYAAYDTVKHRHVAVKLLPERFSRDEEYRERFRREAQLVARINNPHVVPVHDFGEINGILYLEMVRVQGRDLATLIKSRGRLAPDRAVDVLVQVADAVDVAHGDGLVHRDIKPANIFLTDRGFAYLGDFGIAASRGPRQTTSGVVVGSLPYMAPERFTNAPTTGAVDIYALGCVLFELVTGRAAYGGKTVESLIHAQLNAPVPASGIPALDPVIARATAKDPAARYRTAGELARAARGALQPPPATSRRWRTGAIVATVVALLAVATGVFAWANGGKAEALQLLPADRITSGPFTDTTVSTPPSRLTSDVHTRGEVPAGTSVGGGSPALYGTTGSTPVCNSDVLIAGITSDPQKASVWAGLQGISTNDISSFVKSLTPVVLRLDTAVTNSDYRHGKAVKFPAVLQAGTAVLVDDRGRPRVKCNCGNPLLEPPNNVLSMPTAGAPWTGYHKEQVRTISSSAQPLRTIRTVDVRTGQQSATPVAVTQTTTDKEAIRRFDFGNAMWRVPDMNANRGDGDLSSVKLSGGKGTLQLNQYPNTVTWTLERPAGMKQNPEFYADINGDGYLDAVVAITPQIDDRTSRSYVWVWDPMTSTPVQLTPAVASIDYCSQLNGISMSGADLVVDQDGHGNACETPRSVSHYRVSGRTLQKVSGSRQSASSSPTPVPAPTVSSPPVVPSTPARVSPTPVSPSATPSSTATTANCGYTVPKEPSISYHIETHNVSCLEAARILAKYEAMPLATEGNINILDVEGWTCYAPTATSARIQNIYTSCQKDPQSFTLRRG